MEDDIDFSGPAIEPTTCANCGKVDFTVKTIVEGDSFEEDDTEGEFCFECANEAGYCFGCGLLSAGTNAYDFGRIKGYCENCQDQIRSTVSDDNYDTDDDYNYEEWMQMQ